MSNLGIGTDKLKPKAADSDSSISVKLLSEFSFYTRPNFEFVTENVNSDNESISINFQGRDLTDYIEFKSNLVLTFDDISPQFNGITTAFELKNNSISIKKSIVPADIQSPINTELSISKLNHDFSTGEVITYKYDTTPINVLSSTGVTTSLSETLYAIKSSKNVFKVARTESEAFSGIGITFVSVGSGTTHHFSSYNFNTRSLVTLDNIIQSPLYFDDIQTGLTTSVGITTDVIPLAGISSIKTSNYALVDNELMKVVSVSSGTTSIIVERGSLGTVSVAHSNGTNVYFYDGNYNIKDGNIYFTGTPSEGSTFNGRAFYKIKYDKNVVFDNISTQFVGTAKTFTLKKISSNYGLSTSTVTGEPYGILSVNGLFQHPEKNYTIQSNTGISTLVFVGNDQFSLPNSGKILQFSYNGGSGYQPLVAAAATVSVSAGGTISAVYLTGTGSGYLTSPTVSISSTVGSGASITALVGTGASVGFITSFTITNPGSGYTSTSIPQIIVENPYGYVNLPLVYKNGSGQGQGAKVSLTVGTGGTVTSIDIDEIGYGYKNGDVLTVSGIGTYSPHTKLELTVDSVYSDKFSFWSFGKLTLTKTDELPDGIRKIFRIDDKSTGEPLSFEKNIAESRFELANNLIVFVNGILQEPVKDYTVLNNFIRFKEAIPLGQTLDIYLYTASNDDSVLRNIIPTIKIGDFVKILGRPGFEVEQEERSVLRIQSKSEIKTNTYDGLGINSDQEAFRKLDWKKQVRDDIVSGRKIYKSRPNYNPDIKPKSSLIAGIGTTSTEIYVENIDIFDIDGIEESNLQVEVVKDIPLNQATASSVVSAAGTVSQINVVNGGSGYSQSSPPLVTVSSKEILSKNILNSFLALESSSQIKYYDTHYSNFTAVSVGSSLSYKYTTSLATFTNSTISTGSTSLRSVSYGNSIWVTVGDSGFISTTKNLSTWNSVGIATVDTTSYPEIVSPISFTHNLNSITYSPISGKFVGVGSNGSILTYDVIDPERLQVLGNNFIFRNSNTTANLNKVIVDNIFDNVVGYQEQYVAIGNSATILVSASTIDGNNVGTPSVIWSVAMSENVSATGLSGANLTSITHTGISTIPFIVTGENGLILTFPNNKLNPGSFYKVTPAPTSETLKSVTYDPLTETAIVVGTSGTAFISTKKSMFQVWNPVSIGTTINLNDIEYIKHKDRYLIVGDSVTYTNNPEKVAAAATAFVSSSGIVTSIAITNGGMNYDPNNYPIVTIDPPKLQKERFKSCKIIGDYGKIVGIATTTLGAYSAVQFQILREDSVGIITSGISTGDYLEIYNTNIGNGITAITSIGSTVGIGTTFIDCVYKVGSVLSSIGSSIVTVTCNVTSISGLISIPSGYYTYGNYSWGKIYDFDSRTNPIQIDAETFNGTTGLTTSPKIVRVTSIGTTSVPLEA